MSSELLLLTGTGAAIAVGHTLLGPDHYLPFIVMAKARRWSLRKTAWITVLCGLGHIVGSVVLGLVGIAAGVALHVLELTETVRGEIAAWLLMAFGLVYGAWGVRQAIRNRPHTHRHVHAGHDHAHTHTHAGTHVHVHAEGAAGGAGPTPWVLFTIFLFGPCEPLIPILMYPAAAESPWGVALVASVFGLVTVGTMLALVLAGTYGLGFARARRLTRYSHALAGGVILLCGVAIHLGR